MHRITFLYENSSDKDKYIVNMSSKNASRKKQKTDTQINVDNQHHSEAWSPISVERGVDTDSDRVKHHENTLNAEPLKKIGLPTLLRVTRSTGRFSTGYQCNICHLTFSSNSNLRAHSSYYRCPKIPCEKCGLKLPDSKQLKFHVASAHLSISRWESRIKCRLCNQSFRVKRPLQAHLAHYHNYQKVPVESICAKEPAVCPIKIEDVRTDTSHWTNNYADGADDSEWGTEVQSRTTPEVCLETAKRAEYDGFLTKTVENVVIPTATNSQNRDDEEESKVDEGSRKDEKTASKKTQNTDVLQRDLRSTYENEGTRKDEHPIGVNDTNSRELNDTESKSSRTITENEQAFSFSVESTQVHDSQLKNKSDARTNGNEQSSCENWEKVRNVQSRLRSTENEGGKSSRVNQNAESEKHWQLQKDMKPTALTPAVLSREETPVTNKTTTEVEEAGVEVGRILRFSNDYDAIDNFHDIPEDKIVRTCTDSQKKSQKNNTDESLQLVRNSEKERDPRKLYSCKDCYVLVERLKLPERSGETVATSLELTQPQVRPKYTVIPSVLCNRTFASREVMLRHYQQYHLTFTDTRVNCVCGKNLNNDKVALFHFYRHCEKTVQSFMLPRDSRASCKPLKKTFVCDVCDKRFWLKSCLRSHVHEHSKHGVEPKVSNVGRKSNIEIAGQNYSCQVCDTTFTAKYRLLQHMKTYSSLANYRCKLCGTIFGGMRQLNNHKRAAHGLNIKPGYPFVCTICNQHFLYKRTERLHRLHFHQDQDIAENNCEPPTHDISPPDSDDDEDDVKSVNKCNVCNIEFSSKKRFIDHTIYYMKSEIIQCKTCGERFQGQYRAHHHIKTVHYSANMRMAFTHHCNVCKEGFIYMTHLQAHVLHVHINEAKVATVASQNDGNEFGSQQCNNQSVDKLMYQLRDRDDGIVPSIEYACTVCNAKFPTSTLLALHEIDFSNDGEYLCNRCSTKCRTPAKLLDHLTLNHSDSAIQVGVKCRRCRENFLTYDAWVSHIKHFHVVDEPSEFYLEKNVRSAETSGDVMYEWIPTNESIASRVTYFRVKSSIDFPSEKVGQGSSVSDLCGANAIVLKEELMLDSSDEETEETSIDVVDERPKLHVPVMNDFIEIEEHNIDTSTFNVVEVREASKPAWHHKWICDVCGYYFSGPADLAKHVALYSDSGKYSCDICGRSFPVQDFNAEHTLNHVSLDGNKYFCSFCREAFKSLQCIKMHVAHFHPQTLNELPSIVCDINSTSEPGEQPESRSKGQNNVRLGPWPENSSYQCILPRCLENTKLPTRSYSDKRSEQLATVPANDVNTNKKDVKMTVYECSNCDATYFSLNRLKTHLTTVHNRYKNHVEGPSKNFDDHATCNICDNVFANRMVVLGCKRRDICIKSIQVSKTFFPELEITPPIRSPNDPKDSQRPVGQLHNLDEVNQLPMPVIRGKDGISKKFTVARIFGPTAEQQKQLNVKPLNQLMVPQENPLEPKQQDPSGAKQQNLTHRLNSSEAEQQKSPTNEDGSTIVGIQYRGSARGNVLKPVIPSNSEPTSLSPAALIEPREIVKRKSCSTATTDGKMPARVRTSTARKGLPKSKPQYLCNVCNIAFIYKTHLDIHRANVHPLGKSNHEPTRHSVVGASSSDSSDYQYHQSASSLSTLPNDQNGAKPQSPHTLHFESVLLPESADDFELFEDGNLNNAELESQANQPNDSAEKRVTPDNRVAGSLKVRSFAKIVNTSREKSNLKRQYSGPIYRRGRKHSKGVFDPVAYAELCRQHNLLPE